MEKTQEKQKTYRRFNISQRVEHWVLFLSFTLLGLTGLPQKFATSPISEFVVSILGGIETARIIHRISAVVFILQSVFHVVVVGYEMFVLRVKAEMLPNVKDALDAIQSLLYNLGFSKEKPKMGKFNFTEKAEYWALIWGLVVMGVTGFILWNPIISARILPGEIIPAAKAAHGAEAVLAVLAILLWHLYHVHIRSFNKSMFTGNLDHHEMEDEHALQLEQIEAGIKEEPVSPSVYKKRMRIFTPIAAVFSISLLVGIYFFVNYEETAINTVPPASQVLAFAPQTPTPFPTADASLSANVPIDLGSGELTWNQGIGGLFQAKCGSCHGTMGGLSLLTYEDILAGGDAGAAIVPGDPSAGSVMAVQLEGGHSEQFTDEELEYVRTWIENGAVEGQAASGLTGELTWDGSVAFLFESCLDCHGGKKEITAGGVSFASYEAFLEGGNNGVLAAAGDPGQGTLIPLMESGDHSVVLSDAELSRLIEWIEAGMPEN